MGLEEVEAVAVGQAQVEQHQVGLPAGHEIRRHRQALGAVDRVAGLRQTFLERPADELFVFDDQDLGQA